MYINKNLHHSISINTILNMGFILNTDKMIINYKINYLIKLLLFYLLINFVLKTKQLTNSELQRIFSYDCNEIATMAMKNSVNNDNFDENVCVFKPFSLI